MAELLAPGFRFYPTEEELLRFYLRNKLDGVRRGDIERVIPVADVCALDPWELPGTLLSTGIECISLEREARGGRPSRTTPSGYWKAAGTPGLVYAADGRPIGTKKTMVFYRGRAPAGAKTKWKLNEYKALEDEDEYAAQAAAPAPTHALQTRGEFTLCRLYTKSGCPWQFDRRPSAAAAAAGGGSENAAAAVTFPNGEQTGQKRKRAAPPSDDSSSSDGDTQQLLRQRGTNEVLNDDMVDWSQFLDWL
ncbi:NAC domain-containing protein 90 [Dichanthelium oligosanthes]|uniref:NAC domain-containing protein 90 n=1 Tax=Dichanthelium oligosanthes TaxID=888268 RepID=A0A1E5UZ45_9POAL|nr:NAC domain-containing protein 90 [Dichanthelium oligosanthes]